MIRRTAVEDTNQQTVDVETLDPTGDNAMEL
jgi:hypothetical protein